MPRRIKITFLITDLHLGGSPLVLRDLAVGLGNFRSQKAETGSQNSEFQIQVISLKPLPPPSISHSAFDIPHSFPIHSLNLRSARDLPRAIPRLAKLVNTFSQGRPHIVYSILIHANALATFTLPFLNPRPRLIHSIHTLQARPGWHWTLQGLLCPIADALIAPAQPILDKLARHGPLPERTLVISNGIDISKFDSASPFLPAQLPWPEGSPVVGYVGRFDPVKNLPLLVGAFAKLGRKPDFPQPQLALVGYGPEEPGLRALATSLHIAPFVHFPGPTATPERWYKSFTCHCLPSTAEGFGLTLVEAAAAGLPIAAVRTPVTAAILDPLHQAVISRPDETLLAMALQSLIARHQASPFGPISPPKASHWTLEYLRNHYSTSRMIAVHVNFLRNF